MKTRNLLFMAVAGMVLAACSFDSRELEYDSEGPAELRINATMGMTITRGSADLQNTQLSSSSSPAVYVSKTSTTNYTYASKPSSGTYDYSNVAMTPTAAGTGTTTSLAITDQTTIPAFYFPQDKGALDVLLYAPRVSSSPNIVAMPITVASNQTADANYIASDFVFGKATNVAWSSPNANIKLYHALTKIKLILQDNNGQNISGLADATLSTLKTDATVNITSAIVDDDGSTSGTNEMVEALKTAVTLGSTVGTVTLFNGTYTAGDILYGIIPPKQDASAITLTLTISGSTYSGHLSSTSLTLDPGTMYTFTVSLDQAALIITTTEIANWESGSGTTTVN